MTVTLWRGAGVRTPAAPGADALVEGDGVVVWVGREEDIGTAAVDRTVVLDGGTMLPAFVDAHVHLTATGLALDGLDLHDASSLRDCLDRVERHCRERRGAAVLGTGWDETRWPERRPPTAAELDRASYGGVVYLARADVHSAIASSALLAATRRRVPSYDGLAGAGADGRVTLDAHHAVRETARESVSATQTRDAQRRARQHAATLGVGSLHEMSGPEVAGEPDLASLVALCDEEPGVDVVTYWAALGDLETPSRHGCRGAGGDLFVDGSVGSRTAALSEPYADSPDTSGVLRYDVPELADHIVAATRAGLQTGFHVIGDDAIARVLDAYDVAEGTVGLTALRRNRPRFEHVELLSTDAVARMARIGAVASVQPAFDAEWGGPDGMYVDRLGAVRAARMNPFAALASAGVTLAFGADSPVCAIDPWGGVRAATGHQTPAHRVSTDVAFAAATRGGRLAAGEDEAGVLVAGAPATFAIWDSAEVDAPTCLRTVVRGRTVHSVEEAMA